jgi:FtsZ-interacting cell division protein ZipA
MYRKLVLCLCMILIPAVMATPVEPAQVQESESVPYSEPAEPVQPGEPGCVTESQPVKSAQVKEPESFTESEAQDVDKRKKLEAKELSGMSIIGNDEAPKSLYIVPWKSSEIGVETSLDMMLNEGDVPVDRDVFMRQLDFYQVSTAK